MGTSLRRIIRYMIGLGIAQLVSHVLTSSSLTAYSLLPSSFPGVPAWLCDLSNSGYKFE